MDNENPTIAGKFWQFIIKNLVAEIIVAVVAGLLVAYIVQEGRFAPEKESSTSQPQVQNTLQSSESVVSIPTPRINELITVEGNVRWGDSGITVNEGDLIKISYKSGEWGGTSGISTIGWDCDSATYSDGLMPTAPGSSLIGKIGDSAPFCVGASPVITSQSTGKLYFSLNDCVSTGCYGDNHGSIVLLVSVTSK
jgi:hypothetical protein